MTGIAGLIAALKKVGAVDQKLLQILGERKKLEKEHKAKLDALQKLEKDKLEVSKKLSETKRRYQKEESQLKLERSGLEMRRTALASLANYKLQQAAEREIEHALSELEKAEEAAMEILSESDKLDSLEKSVAEKLAAAEKDLKVFEEEARGHTLNLNERQTRNEEERASLVAAIDKTTLQTYERIRDKFPDSPVVAVKSGNCSSCFMAVGPQMGVQLLKGDTLVRCRGCGRILHSEAEKEE